MEAKVNKLIKEYEQKIEQLQPSIKSAESDKRYYRKAMKRTKSKAAEDNELEYNDACRRLEKLNIKHQCYVQAKADIESLLDY